MKVFVTYIAAMFLTSDTKQKAETLEEQEALLKNLKDDEFVQVMLKQNYENVQATSLLSLGNRLIGHEKHIQQKEELSANAFLNFTKKAIEVNGLKIGQELPNIQLNVRYPFIHEADGIVTVNNDMWVEPIISTSKNEIHFYEHPELKTEYFPKVRMITISENIAPHQRIIESPGESQKKIPYFSGEKRDENNRKTPEYQDYLNKMYKYYEYFKPTSAAGVGFLSDTGEIVSARPTTAAADYMQEAAPVLNLV